MKKLGLYVHIPFCSQKCKYCDFLSFESNGMGEEQQREYITALLDEIRISAGLYSEEYSVNSIFIGGGTPSLIQEALIADVMDAIKVLFVVDEDAEITIETNPGTLNKEKLEVYRSAGINRLSMGVQSLDDKCLKLLGRIHGSEDFYKNFETARQVGFSNINVDLMFSIPGQTLEIWRDTLIKIMSLRPEHISFYSLQIEEGTPFFQMFKNGILDQNSDEKDRQMYHDALRMLKEEGYDHYEISNASLPGHSCRHNLKYWSFEEYLGLGLGAHSFMGGVRFSNVKTIKEYGTMLQNSELPRGWNHGNTREDDVSEYIFTGLRKTEGIDLHDIEKRFGAPIEEIYSGKWPKINKYIEDKYLINRDDKLKFSESGIDISNKILVEFV